MITVKHCQFLTSKVGVYFFFRTEIAIEAGLFKILSTSTLRWVEPVENNIAGFNLLATSNSSKSNMGLPSYAVPVHDYDLFQKKTPRKAKKKVSGSRAVMSCGVIQPKKGAV